MAADEVTETASFCRICNAMCGILVSTAGDRVVEVRGDPAHPLSRGYTCPKGRALAQFHHHPNRLDHPTVRGVATDWTTALDDIASTIRALIDGSGPDSVAMYLASGSAFDTNGRRAAERFLRVLGSRQKYTATTIDTPSKPLVAELVGGWSGLTPIWDHQRSTLLVLFGSNPVVSHGHSNAMPDPVRRLRDHRRTRDDGRAGELWVVDPRRTETAALADHHLQIRAGTDHVLLAHLVRELLHDGADEDHLEAHATGVAQLRDAVERYDLATTAHRTGLATEQIDGLVAAIRRHGRISGLTGTGVSMAAPANVAEWLLWALHVVTASYDRPGGMWFNPGYLMQLDTRTWTASDGTPEPGPASRPELPRRFDEYPCAGLVDEIEAGNVRGLLVVGGNPLTALPDENRTRLALASLDLLVVIDVIDTATTALATHVLPAAGQLERSDLPWLLDAYQLEVATQYTPAVVAPGARREPVWRTFAALGERLGLDVLPRGMVAGSTTDDDLLRAIADRSRGGAESVFAARSGTVAEGGTPFGWVTDSVLPDGRWRLAPGPLLAQLATLDDTTAVGYTEAPAAEVALRLIPQRRLRMMNSQLRGIAARGGRLEAPHLTMHPDDAAQRGVVDGTTVTVTSTTTGGVLRAEAKVDDRIARGTVSLPHGWDDVNVSQLTSASIGVDPLTGMVLQSGLPVEVRPQQLR
jgi:anaerobic selenocysteine-containing dehydrogenase